MDKHATAIIDAPLPDAVNFQFLKQYAIEQLQGLAGDAWTNYNDSDPGVTILDQLCYALTELGYCAGFPVADILTGEDGRIRYEGQFFEPQHILTCSPVTVDDYRRLVLDRLADVRALYLQPEWLAAGPSGRYQVLFAVDGDQDDGVAEAAAGRVHALLNQHRNLGEMFLPPQRLISRAIVLGGTVRLAPQADGAAVQARIEQALRGVAAPQPVRAGYGQLRASGVAADRIFDGPRMARGWIAGALPSRCRHVELCALTALIAGLEGVDGVEQLCLEGEAATPLPIAENEIPVFTLGKDFLINGAALPAPAGLLYLNALQARQRANGVEAGVDLQPALPHGRYRDIAQYYSIQNTFPDNFGVGHNSLQSDAPSYRVAVARQLKGYLLVYDQLLANQFAQLAHAGDLFSFAPAPARPHGLPARPFETTYYCQPLYDVPEVPPLLRGSDVFHYQLDPAQPEKLVELAAWKKYRRFPFNEYLHGLYGLMESGAGAAPRRERMLDHLMARHGDDAARYDGMMTLVCRYGSQLRTRIAVKSIWLQNFQILSYHRTRAASFDRAGPDWPPAPSGMPGGMPVRDGEPDLARLFAGAQVRDGDLARYSAFELKAGILLGLAEHYGMLAARLQALMAMPGFAAWCAVHQPDQPFPAVADGLALKWGAACVVLWAGRLALMEIRGAHGYPSLDDYRAHVQQLQWLALSSKGFLLQEHVLLAPAPGTAVPGGMGATLVLPDYVTLAGPAALDRHLDTLAELHWPAHLGLRRLRASFVWLRGAIPQYTTLRCGWQAQAAAGAATRFGAKGSDGARKLAAAADALTRLLRLDKAGGGHAN
jgi:hypothetical protein